MRPRMAKKSSRIGPEVIVATRDEVDAAIEALTPAQLLKLKKFAAWRVRGLGRATLGRDADVLLQDAFLSTLLGSENTGEGRRWNKAVDFVKHMTEAMRSISDHWKTQFDADEPHLESEVIAINDEGEEYSPLEAVSSQQPQPDRVLLAKEEVRQIFNLFESDDDAILVLEGWVDGMTGPDMMDLGFTKERFEATVKRIRYNLGRRERGGV
jgi:hypothetical protein